MDDKEISERGFRDEYRRVFDGIHASDELRRRVLEQGGAGVSRNIKKPAFYTRMRPYIAAATAAAAGLAIFAAVRQYDFEGGDDGVISETSVMQTEAPDRAAERSDSAKSGAEDDAAPVSTPAAETKTAEAPSAGSSSARTRTTEELQREALEKYGAPTARPKLSAPESEKAAKAPETGSESGGSYSWTIEDTESAPKSSAETQPAAAEEAAENETLPRAAQASGGAAPALKSSAAGRGIVLSMNSPSVYNAYAAETANAYAAETYSAETSETTYEVWSNEDYAEYLGADVTEKASLPSDFEYIGGGESGFMVDEDGDPVNDSKLYAFEGEGERYANIVTSRDTVYADTYLSDPELAKSDINGTDAVVFDMENGSYKCYMVYDEVSYVTDTEGMTETELSELLGSLASE